MTPDTDPFLRAILAAPDDDLPRYLMADHLDEQGQPERAEFIRVQCELARLTGNPCVACAENDCACKCAGCLLRRRAAELDRLDGNRTRETIAPLKLIHKRDGKEAYLFSVAFHRGFISELTCTAADWLAHADAILGACPIANAKDGLVRLMTWPALEENSIAQLRLARSGQELGTWLPIAPIDNAARDEYYRPRVLQMLAAEWSGVRFELPAARGTEWSHIRLNPSADVRRVMGAMERVWAEQHHEGD